MPRAYDNSKRARKAAETADRIADATEMLLASRALPDVTLQAIADEAGVTVQTVLRHMGSRGGCVEAVALRVAQRVDAQRGTPTPGDVDGAVGGLVEHYEAEGALILALLAQEGIDLDAREMMDRGRAYHRDWVVRCFGSLADLSDEGRVDALVAATDLYVWKLLRLDLGRSAEATRAVVARLVRATLEAP